MDSSVTFFFYINPLGKTSNTNIHKMVVHYNSNSSHSLVLTWQVVQSTKNSTPRKYNEYLTIWWGDTTPTPLPQSPPLFECVSAS